jgi:dipeptidase E
LFIGTFALIHEKSQSMSTLRVLAFSSSRVGNTGYLETAAADIKAFLGDLALHIALVPFAAADNNYDGYLAKTQTALAGLPYVISVATPKNARQVIEHAQVIMVGGGNTFKLLHDLYQFELVELIKHKVKTGTPYIGWSAGSNITGLTIGTTNDMPIIEPQSFKALGFFPFQINPHYINVKADGHNGETRDERLREFLKVNAGISIVGLPEGTALRLEDKTLKLEGQEQAVLFQTKSKEVEPVRKIIESGFDLSFLL